VTPLRSREGFARPSQIPAFHHAQPYAGWIRQCLRWRSTICFRLWANFSVSLRWWSEQDVLGLSEGIKRFQHQRLGGMHFEHTTFIVENAADLRLVVYTPLPGESSKKMALVR
jgi:hypothetical protein